MAAFLIFAAVFTFSASRCLYDYRWSFWAYGDAQMLNAGIHFRDEGFVKHNFLPLVNPGYVHDLIANNLPNGRYSHYPALHAVVIGLLGKVFEDPLIPSRLVAVFFGSLSVLLWYFAIRRIFGDAPAVIASLFIGFSVLNLEFIDALCGQPYDEFLRSAAVLTLLASEAGTSVSGSRNHRLLVGLLWALMFIESLNSVEYIAFLFLFAVGYYALAGKLKQSLPKIAFFLSAPVLGLSLHFFQTCLEYGGILHVMSDWGDVITNRMTSKEAGLQVGATGDGAGLYFETLRVLFRYLKTYFVQYYLTALLGLLLFLVVFFVRRVRGGRSTAAIDRRARGFWALLFLCSLLFNVFLPAHAYNMRDYIPKHVFPAVAILFGVAASFFLTQLFSPTGLRTPAGIFLYRAVCFSGIVLIALPFATVGKYMAKYPNLLDSPKWAVRQTSLDEWKDRIHLARVIRAATSPGDIVLVPQGLKGNRSLEANPIEEYYAQRHLVPMGTTPNDAARRIDRLYTYRDEFASREPRLLRAGLFAFIDKTAVPRSIQYQLLSNYLCVSPETGPEKGRFQVCPITRRPVLLPPRSVESILSEAEAIWTFDDSSSRISDARGEHPATGINTMAVAGKANGAVWLNGSNAYVSTALNLKGWKSFTIAFWVKPDLTSRDDIAVILDNGSNQMENFALQSIGNSLTWFSWIYGSSAAFELPTGTWTHVTLTADLASRQIQVYLNGLKKVSIDTPAIKGPGPVPLTFGKWATADARYFRGALDEIEVWDYVLEEEDIPRLYEYQATGRRPQRQTPPPSNL